MSGMLFRVDSTEKVLRSVGDPPNGLVSIATPSDGECWVVDSRWMPQTPRSERTSTFLESAPHPNGMTPTSTRIDVEDLVDGLAGAEEAVGLIRVLGVTVQWVAAEMAPTLQFECVREHIDLAIATRDALIAAGYLTQRG